MCKWMDWWKLCCKSLRSEQLQSLFLRRDTSSQQLNRFEMSRSRANTKNQKPKTRNAERETKEEKKKIFREVGNFNEKFEKRLIWAERAVRNEQWGAQRAGMRGRGPTRRLIKGDASMAEPRMAVQCSIPAIVIGVWKKDLSELANCGAPSDTGIGCWLHAWLTSDEW